MSRENVEVVRRAYEAFSRGDLDAAVADMASDCEYVATGTIPGLGGMYRGPEGFRRFLSWILDEFDDTRVEIDELIAAEDRVLASVTNRGRGKRSGAETSWHVWQLWTLREGKVVHGQGFTSGTEALEAVGLRE